MDRLLYLVSLLVLQAALIREVTPTIAEFVRAGAALSQAPDVSTLTLRFALGLAAVAGAAPVLGAPSLALLRHWQRGSLRFLGLPRWGRRIAASGALLYVTARLIESLPPAAALLDRNLGAMVDTTGFTVGHAAVALMCGGTLAAELLRRSVAPARRLSEVMPIRHIQVQVVHPDALRGRTASG